MANFTEEQATAFADILLNMSPREILTKLEMVKGKNPLTEFVYKYLLQKCEQSFGSIENNMAEGFKALSKEQANRQKQNPVINTLIK